MPRRKKKVDGRVCRNCGVFKSWGDYHRSGSYPDGTSKYRPDCKPCFNQKQRETYQDDPEKFRERKRTERWRNRDSSLDKERQWRKRNPLYRVKQKYGLEPFEYERILGQQGGSCANKACNATENLVVDHCHDTGAIRGILCSTCNSGLGMLGDSEDRVLGIYKYLKENERYGPKAEGKRTSEV